MSRNLTKVTNAMFENHTNAMFENNTKSSCCEDFVDISQGVNYTKTSVPRAFLRPRTLLIVMETKILNKNQLITVLKYKRENNRCSKIDKR